MATDECLEDIMLLNARNESVRHNSKATECSSNRVIDYQVADLEIRCFTLKLRKHIFWKNAGSGFCQDFKRFAIDLHNESELFRHFQAE
jgi:hypothetical protein